MIINFNRVYPYDNIKFMSYAWLKDIEIYFNINLYPIDTFFD